MALKHKHLRLDQQKLDRARAFLGAATEQETVDAALDALVAEGSIVKVHRALGSTGGFDDTLGRQRRARRVS